MDIISRKGMLGSSLIESVVALLILSIGFVGVAKLQAELTANNSLSKQRTEASTIAQDMIEEYRSFGEMSTTSGFEAYSDIASERMSITGVNAVYAAAAVVTESTSPAYKTVTVTVGWTGATREAQTISLSTIIAGQDPTSIANYSSSSSTITPTVVETVETN